MSTTLFVLAEVKEEQLILPSLTLMHSIFESNESFKCGQAGVLNLELLDKNFCFMEIELKSEKDVSSTLNTLENFIFKNHPITVYKHFCLSKNSHGVLLSAPIDGTVRLETSCNLLYSLPLASEHLLFVANDSTEPDSRMLHVYLEDKKAPDRMDVQREFIQLIEERRIGSFIERNSF